MRLPILLVVIVLAGTAATSAHATVRPLRPGDAALLNRSPTPEERVAESVAKRLTRLSPAVRCGDLGISVPPGMLVSGITLLPPHGPADYFLLLPADLQLPHLVPGSRRRATTPPPARSPPASSCASNAAFALATVSHESYHVLGYRVEKQVECYGMQSIWYVATSLGASVAEGQRIAAYYWQTTYARRQYTTPAYWSTDCRDGGKYDLRPASHAWPS